MYVTEKSVRLEDADVEDWRREVESADFAAATRAPLRGRSVKSLVGVTNEAARNRLICKFYLIRLYCNRAESRMLVINFDKQLLHLSNTKQMQNAYTELYKLNTNNMSGGRHISPPRRPEVREATKEKETVDG